VNEINNISMHTILNRLAIGQCRLLRVACRRAGNLNRNIEAILNAPLRNLDRLGDVVQPGQRPKGANWRIACLDGKREAAERFGDDMCDERETVRATLSGDELREWENRNCPT